MRYSFCFACRCGNVNWARRSDCNMCGHPKFSKVEFRTGDFWAILYFIECFIALSKVNSNLWGHLWKGCGLRNMLRNQKVPNNNILGPQHLSLYERVSFVFCLLWMFRIWWWIQWAWRSRIHSKRRFWWWVWWGTILIIDVCN